MEPHNTNPVRPDAKPIAEYGAGLSASDMVFKYMRSGFKGIVGSPVNFCRLLCEMNEGMTGGNDHAHSVTYGCYTSGGQKKDVIQLQGESAYEVSYETHRDVTLTSIDPKIYQYMRSTMQMHPVSLLISKFKIEKEYKTALDILRRKQLEEKQYQEAEKRKKDRENDIDTVLTRISRARSGDMIFPVKGMRNILALIDRGYVPGISDNPDVWIDAEEVATLSYRNAQKNEELLLIGREKLQAVSEPDRIEYKFLVIKSSDKPKDFLEKHARFNRKKDGDPSRDWKADFFSGLEILTKYPEELKNKTAADLDVMARAIDVVIGERSRIDEGLIALDSLFRRETGRILAEISETGAPFAEIRKTLDYFEHTGMVKPAYKDCLCELIKMKSAGIVLYDLLARGDRQKTLAYLNSLPQHHTIDMRIILEGTELQTISGNQEFKDYIYTNGALHTPDTRKKRVKVVVALVLKSIPGEINAANITAAMQPYIDELGLDELDKIRQRILELKEVVLDQQENSKAW